LARFELCEGGFRLKNCDNKLLAHSRFEEKSPLPLIASQRLVHGAGAIPFEI